MIEGVEDYRHEGDRLASVGELVVDGFRGCYEEDNPEDDNYYGEDVGYDAGEGHAVSLAALAVLGEAND